MNHNEVTLFSLKQKQQALFIEACNLQNEITEAEVILYGKPEHRLFDVILDLDAINRKTYKANHRRDLCKKFLTGHCTDFEIAKIYILGSTGAQVKQECICYSIIKDYLLSKWSSL